MSPVRRATAPKRASSSVSPLVSDGASLPARSNRVIKPSGNKITHGKKPNPMSLRTVVMTALWLAS